MVGELNLAIGHDHGRGIVLELHVERGADGAEREVIRGDHERSRRILGDDKVSFATDERDVALGRAEMDVDLRVAIELDQ